MAPLYSLVGWLPAWIVGADETGCVVVDPLPPRPLHIRVLPRCAEPASVGVQIKICFTPISSFYSW